MTSAVSSVAATLVCTLTALAVVKVFTPSEKTVKIISLVMGVFLLISVLSPLVSFFEDFDLKTDLSQNEYINSAESTVNNKVLEETATYINSYTAKLLESIDVKYKNIETTMGNSEEEGIYIKSISIYIDEKESIKKKQIEDAVLGSLYVAPQIICKEE